MLPNVRSGHWLFMTTRALQPAFLRLCWLAGAFCQPVQCACAKVTSRVGKHETSYSQCLYVNANTQASEKHVHHEVLYMHPEPSVGGA